MKTLIINFESSLSLDDIKVGIKKVKVGYDNKRYHFIKSRNDNSIVFERVNLLGYNIIESFKTQFTISNYNQESIYELKATFQGYSLTHYLIIVFIMIFVILVNFFIFAAILGIFKYRIYPVFIISLFVAIYLLTGKPIKYFVLNEMNRLIWLIKNSSAFESKGNCNY